MILLAQLIIYIAALAGIVCGALGALFFAGGAFNRARPREFRIRRGVYAALCVCAIVASAALGFAGIAAIMYFAQQS
jgi:H+/Cl- antiporter ClcA